MKITGIGKGILWLFAAYFYAGLVGGRLPYFILYASIGVMFVSFLWTRLLLRVNISGFLHTNRSDVGKTILMKIFVENNSVVPLPWIHLSMNLPEAFGPENRQVSIGLSLKSREVAEVEVPLSCQVRGFFQWGIIEVRTGDIFGIFQGIRKIETRLNLLVRPKTEYLGRNYLRSVDSRFGDWAWSIKPGRQVAEFRGVRAYTPGDSMGQIHWKASARADRFLVKEYDQNILKEILVFLDLSSSLHFGSSYDNSVERAVAVAASLSGTAIREGLRVGCAIGTDDLLVVPPARSRGHLGLLLDCMARAFAGPGVQLPKALLQEMMARPRGTMLALVTPSLDEEVTTTLTFLANRGYRSFVALIKAEDFGCPGIDSQAREREISRLKHFGIRVLPVDRQTDLRTLFGGVSYEAC